MLGLTRTCAPEVGRSGTSRVQITNGTDVQNEDRVVARRIVPVQRRVVAKRYPRPDLRVSSNRARQDRCRPLARLNSNRQRFESADPTA
jgi:hypothetical protein